MSDPVIFQKDDVISLFCVLHILRAVEDEGNLGLIKNPFDPLCYTGVQMRITFIEDKYARVRDHGASKGNKHFLSTG